MRDHAQRVARDADDRQHDEGGGGDDNGGDKEDGANDDMSISRRPPTQSLFLGHPLALSCCWQQWRWQALHFEELVAQIHARWRLA